MESFVIVSGCSGGGKSALVEELKRRGYATVEEPGRRVVRQELENCGAALPWNDAAAFARRAIEMSLSDRVSAGANTGWTFFDRGLIDAASALQQLTGELVPADLAQNHRYNRPIYSCKGDNPAVVNLRLGGVRQRAELPPKMQGFCGSAMPWAWDIGAVPRVPESARKTEPK